MSKSWLYVLGVMIAANVLLHIYPYVWMSLLMSLVVLVAAYFILRRDPFIDFRASMLFILGLTAINVLAALGILSSTMSNIAFIALLVWSMAGGGRTR